VAGYIPGWANLQYPGSAIIFTGDSVTVYEQIWIDGVTNSPGQGAGVTAWIGYNTSNVNPNTWTNWVPTVYNTDAGNNDEYKGTIGKTLPKGKYYYASRFQYNGIYYYGGYSTGGGGFWNGTTFNSGVLLINANPISAPTNLIATNFATKKVNLLWTDNSNNESNFVAERTTDTTGLTGWGVIVTLPLNTQTYQDTTVGTNIWYKWRVKATNADTSSAYSVSASLLTLPIMTTGDDFTPIEYSISQNYPNPFNPVTTIKYSLAKEGNVNLTVYNTLGSKVATIVNEYKPAGNYSIQFNGRNLTSGIYLYRLESGNYSAVKKFILMK